MRKASASWSNLGPGEEQSSQPVTLPTPVLTISRTGQASAHSLHLNISNTGGHFSVRTTELSRVIVPLADEIALVGKKRATGRHKTIMNWVSLIQWGDCIKLLEACLVLSHWRKWHLVASLWESAATRYLLQLTEQHHGSELIASHSLFLLFYLMVTSSLVSCKERPGVANAACFLPLVEILASNASFGCNIPNTHSSLPSLSV